MRRLTVTANAYEPSRDEVVWMIGRIKARKRLAWMLAMLGIGEDSVVLWRQGKTVPTVQSKRIVWTCYAKLYHPEWLASEFDELTWGRLADQPMVRPKPKIVVDQTVKSGDSQSSKE